MEREEYNMQKIKIVTDSTADLSQEVIEKYDIHVLPLSISVNGQTYLDRVDLQPDEFIEEIVRVNTEGLQQYESFCKEKEIPFYPSQTNFIFLPVENAGEIYEACAHAGFIIRPFPNGVRITVGTREQNEGVISVLKQHFENKKNKSRDEANV